jgi:uncharacterized membrane protein YesL
VRVSKKVFYILVLFVGWQILASIHFISHVYYALHEKGIYKLTDFKSDITDSIIFATIVSLVWVILGLIPLFGKGLFKIHKE